MYERASSQRHESQNADQDAVSRVGHATLTQNLPPRPGAQPDGEAGNDDAGDFASLFEENHAADDAGDGAADGDSVDAGEMSFGPEAAEPDGESKDAEPNAEQDAESKGAGGEAADATQIGEAGFEGAASELPYRDELEQSFGMSFAGVLAYRGDRARQACEALGADAYAVGNRIAFRSPNPSKEVVAHELTHVVQHAGPGSAKQTGIETSGEGEAEHVERAVGAGTPARSAMTADSRAHGGGGGRGLAGPVQRRAPNLKANPKFGTGLTFGIPSSNSSTIKKNYSYTLWSPKKGIEIPVGAVPGLNFIVEPGVSVTTSAGIGKGRRGRIGFGVLGEIGVGFSYGKKEVVRAYGKAKGTANGGFQYSRGAGNWWQAEGSLNIESSIEVGISAGNGIFTTSIESPATRIGTLAGIEFEKGKLKKSQLGWDWGPKPEWVFGKIKNAINNAKKLVNKGAKAAGDAWKYLKKHPDKIFLPGPSLAKDLIGAGIKFAGKVIDKINPFD